MTSTWHNLLYVSKFYMYQGCVGFSIASFQFLGWTELFWDNDSVELDRWWCY